MRRRDCVRTRSTPRNELFSFDQCLLAGVLVRKHMSSGLEVGMRGGCLLPRTVNLAVLSCLPRHAFAQSFQRVRRVKHSIQPFVSSRVISSSSSFAGCEAQQPERLRATLILSNGSARRSYGTSVGTRIAPLIWDWTVILWWRRITVGATVLTWSVLASERVRSPQYVDLFGCSLTRKHAIVET